MFRFRVGPSALLDVLQNALDLVELVTQVRPARIRQRREHSQQCVSRHAGDVRSVLPCTCKKAQQVQAVAGSRWEMREIFMQGTGYARVRAALPDAAAWAGPNSALGSRRDQGPRVDKLTGGGFA